MCIRDSNNNMKLDIASESKSLMRMIQSVEVLSQQIQQEEKTSDITEELLENYCTISYLTGEMCIRDRCLNSSQLGYDKCEEIIMECVK